MIRPRIISFICIIGYLSVVFTFPQVFSPQIKKLGVFMPAIYGILVAANFIACVGLWYFKQWGVQLYLISVFAKILFSLLVNQLGFSFYFNLGLSIIFIIVLIRFFPKMDPNL
ncbi:MAG: hypothetical protein Q8T03_11370 [Bacteroidota bacterium]|nr:hypothetical protein [Bacteroidota bacterium]